MSDGWKGRRRARKRGKMVREKRILVREKSVKSQGISFQTKSGHPGKELDVHKTKQKRGRNRTTTLLVLDSSMQRGRWEFRLNQRIWLRLSSVFESLRISFLKIFLVISIHYYETRLLNLRPSKGCQNQENHSIANWQHTSREK